MKRPQASLTEESGTLPMGGSDPTEALPGAPGPRLVLSRYRLERRLGAGGFGVVWLAWDEKLEREVAVKVIPRENGGGERVENEARAAARLNHPGHRGHLRAGLRPRRRVPGLGAGSRPNPRRAAARPRDRRPRRGPHRHGALRGARARARARRDPPRREARQRDGPGRARRRRRLRQARRLRRGARGGRRSAHAHRRRGGHAGLHGARAGRGRARDAGLRRLLARAHPLRGLDRRATRCAPAAPPPRRAGSAARCPRWRTRAATCRWSCATRSTTPWRSIPRAGRARPSCARSSPPRSASSTTRAAWSSRRRCGAWAFPPPRPRAAACGRAATLGRRATRGPAGRCAFPPGSAPACWRGRS